MLVLEYVLPLLLIRNSGIPNLGNLYFTILRIVELIFPRISIPGSGILFPGSRELILLLEELLIYLNQVNNYFPDQKK